jgi:hypothetical protein
VVSVAVFLSGFLFRDPHGFALFVAWNFVFKQRRFTIHSAFYLQTDDSVYFKTFSTVETVELYRQIRV